MAVNSTYTATQDNGNAVLHIASGKAVFDSTSITAADYINLTVGFTPRYVRFVNATDRITIEWYAGMADDTCIKTAANGTQTLETTNKGITVSGGVIAVSQNATLAVIAASKTCYWHAIG